MIPFSIEFEIKTPFQEKYKLVGKADKGGSGPILLDKDKCLFNRKGMWVRLPKFVLHHIMITHGDDIEAAICASE